MKKLEYQVSFTTPAFLGNAEQNGQWRTPPFKALLRQWWRVAAARACAYNPARLREAEGQLFGAANDEGGGSQRSRVRLRLDTWSKGKLQGAWGNDPRVNHREVGPNGREVGAHLYLGYGPLSYQQGTALKANAAIQAGEFARCRLAWPDDEKTVADAIQLMHWFGSLGGRSRNGWGSIAVQHESIAPVIPEKFTFQKGLLGHISRPLRECLELDWPHALGRSADGRLLVWKSRETFSDDWRAAMQALAKAKIEFRTQKLQFAHGETQHQTKPTDIPFEDRHLLAYPVTHHAVAGWAEEFAPGKLKYDGRGWVVQSTRLANQLRFKVTRNADGKLMALIYHLPCGLPGQLAKSLGRQAPSIETQTAIWSRVHDYLDNPANGFARV